MSWCHALERQLVPKQLGDRRPPEVLEAWTTIRQLYAQVRRKDEAVENVSKLASCHRIASHLLNSGRFVSALVEDWLTGRRGKWTRSEIDHCHSFERPAVLVDRQGDGYPTSP